MSWLTCGCCGEFFRPWSTYRDQDQDTGYGICRGCQADDLRAGRRMEQRSFELLADALNETNREKFHTWPRWKKRVLVAQAFKDGHLTWSIAR